VATDRQTSVVDTEVQAHAQPSRRSLYAIKPAFVAVLEPISHRLVAGGVDPSAITLAAIPVEVAAVAALVLGVHVPLTYLLVPPLVIAWMGLNAIDGSVARSTNRSTASGAVLNEFVDRFGDVLVIGAALIVVPGPIAVMVAVGMLTSELVAAIGWAITGRRVFLGPMGKPDRAASLAVGAVAALFWQPALTIAFTVIGIGSLMGAVNRSRHAYVAAGKLDRRRVG
jgi:CDP-diacylglycerol--glycerol-3-phosphate 3-phosphatidyltransferase